MDIILHNLAVGELSVLAGVGQRSNIPAQEADAGWPMGIVRWPTGDLIVIDYLQLMQGRGRFDK